MAGPLEGSVTIPHVGKFPKIAAALGIAATIGLIIWQRHRQSAAAAAGTTSSTTSAYPSDGTAGNPADPNSVDPATGMTYGAEGGGGGQVADNGLQNSATWPWDGTYNNPNDPYSLDSQTGLTYGAEGSGYGGTGGGGGGGGGSAGPPFSTNAQWSQYVLGYFTQNAYSDLSGRTDAIGLYLAGQQVTAQQATYIHDATAIGGTPPAEGPGNFPPSIRQGGGQGGTVTVPNVTEVNVEQATQILTAAGLHAKGPAGVKGVVHQVTRQDPGAGKHVQKGTTVTLTVKNVPEHPHRKPVHR